MNCVICGCDIDTPINNESICEMCAIDIEYPILDGLEDFDLEMAILEIDSEIMEI